MPPRCCFPPAGPRSRPRCALPGSGFSSPQDAALVAFAHAAGLRFPEAFRNLADYLHATRGRLPECYLRKRAAERLGWRPGRDLWAVAPGAAIGGDRFANREGRLPARWYGRYVEADLDYEGGHRGKHRLVFVRDMGDAWLLFVSADHERSFRAFSPR
ncbi:MAG TPA: ribonuclease domain-containing protein [Stellaceae bacterium]|nr:ribonuclease domain-containing protein [Stellaceae bacterium]